MSLLHILPATGERETGKSEFTSLFSENEKFGAKKW